ncbi:MAG: hypothetical protein IBJ18_11775 [Phycisphaerales bacterium]|nr:hypothetical protein [Phycisphaerales bacterium]
MRRVTNGSGVSRGFQRARACGALWAMIAVVGLSEFAVGGRVVQPGIADDPSLPVHAGGSAVEGVRPGAVILLSGLKTLAVREIRAVGEGEVKYIGVDGKPAEIARASVMAIAPTDWAGGASPPTAMVDGEQAMRPRVSTTDGSVIVGDLDTVIAGPEAEKPDEEIGWIHAGLGVRRLKLDQIVRLDMGVRASDSASVESLAQSITAKDGDGLVLRTGEVMRGFVAGFQAVKDGRAMAAGVRIEVDRTPVTIPLSRVRCVVLSNPMTENLSGVVRVWLIDGSRVVCGGFTQENGETVRLGVIGADGGGKDLLVPAAQVWGVMFKGDRARALSACAMIEQSAPGRSWFERARVWPVGGVLGFDDVYLPGAMRVRFGLPGGARRLSCTLVLPDDSRAYADLSVLLEALNERGEVVGAAVTAKLNGVTPAAEVRLPLSAETKSVRVTTRTDAPGMVHSKLFIRRGAVILESGLTEPAGAAIGKGDGADAGSGGGGAVKETGRAKP